ncbi:hypothetical protein DFJ73DRAFT_847859 [Zopfochytrium polystomum]|nr:hypothetical protein DFJ73DRAFT_847859 [Zopfochytrium polystomum]
MTTPQTAAAAVVQQDDVIHAANTEQPHTRLVAIAVDGSKHSEYAFNWAIKHFVRAESDQLLVIHVRPVVKKTYSPVVSDVEEFDRKESYDILHKFAGSLPSDKTYNVRLVSTIGDAREAIAGKVESEKADVLIVGSHGRGPIRKALLGSVSDHLVKHVAVPVIVAKVDAEIPASNYDILSPGVVATGL